jgi:hypothetical protein
VIDYKKEGFSHVLRDYDVVLNSLGKVTLEKSLRVLKPGCGSPDIWSRFPSRGRNSRNEGGRRT